jgi:hypothetical protein
VAASPGVDCLTRGQGIRKGVLPGYQRTYIVGIENSQIAVKSTAHNVKAHLTYVRTDGVDTFRIDHAGVDHLLCRNGGRVSHPSISDQVKCMSSYW